MTHPLPRRCALAALAAAALLLPDLLPAAPGDLDPTFGTGGKVITALSTSFDRAFGVVVQSDGKLVVAGFSDSGTTLNFALARYTVAGALDTTFGGGTGKVSTPVGSSHAQGTCVALQGDGKIVVAGRASNGSNDDFAVVRYTTAGALDTTFGGGTGKVLTPIGSGHDNANSVALQSDGKIIVAGQTYTGTVGQTSDFALVRYTATGALDTTFGGGTGKVTTTVSFAHNIANSVAVQGDGKIIAAGTARSGNHNGFALVRYTDTGALDTSFGSGTGMVVTRLSSGIFTYDDRAYAVAVQSDGKILAAGNADGESFGLIRYTDTGALDATFGGGTGKVTTSFNGNTAYGTCMALQGDGKIVVAGSADNDGMPTVFSNDFALARYTDTGALDTSFGGGTGKVTTFIGSVSASEIAGMAIQGNGRIVVAGKAYNNGANGAYDLAMARYLHSDAIPGSLPTFIEEPTAQTVFVGESATFEALALGSPAPTYQWMKGTSPIDGETGPTLHLDGVTLEEAANYSVVATNAEGSTPSAAAALIVLQTSAPRIVQQPKDVRFRLGRSASFTVSATGTPPLSYQWYNEFGNPVGGATGATLTFPTPSNNVGRYYVVVRNALGQTVQSRLAQLATLAKPLPAPKVKPESQSFSGTVTLQMTCAEPAATIHYTTDGSLPDASSPAYDPASPPVLSETSIVSAVAVHFGARPQSPPSAVKRYFKASDTEVDLGTLEDNRLLHEEALGTSPGTGLANETDRYTFTTTRAQRLRVSVSENLKGGPLTLEVVSPGGQTLGSVAARRGGAIQWESAGEQPAGTYTVRVRLPDGLLAAVDRLRYWPYRLTISGGENWTMLAASGRDTTVHHVGLLALRPASAVVAGKAAWVVSHGRASSPAAENIDSLARTLAAAEGDGTQVLLVDWETAADDNAPTGFRGSDWINRVGGFIAERLQALGITSAKLSLAGHSWGSYVVHEIGKQLTSVAVPPKRLVALDPALKGAGKGINFSAVSQYSWAFYSSLLGHELNAASAHDAFVVGTPFVDPIAAHSAAVTALSRLLQQHLENAGDSLAARFALDQMTPGRWVSNQVAIDLSPLSQQVQPLLLAPGVSPRRARLYRFEAGLLTDDSGSTTQLVAP